MIWDFKKIPSKISRNGKRLKKLKLSIRLDVNIQLPMVGFVTGNVMRTRGNDSTRGNYLTLHRGKFSLDIRRNFFTERVVGHWNGLSRCGVESPSLQEFKK